MPRFTPVLLRGDAVPKIRSVLAFFGGIVALFVMHELMGVTSSHQIDTSIASAAPKHQINTHLFMRQSDPIPQRIDGALRLVFLSDTHGRHEEIPLPLPDGDVLFYLGDACHRGDIAQMRSFAQWIKSSSAHKEIIAIDGNHDRNLLSDKNFMSEWKGVATVLRNEVIAIADGKLTVAALTWDACLNEDYSALKSSMQSWNGGDQTRVDLLLSHFPPYIANGGRGWQGSVGLSKFAAEINPPLHCFGHIHYSRGVRAMNPDITAVNCASTWLQPVVIDYCPKRRTVLNIHCPVPDRSLEANLASSMFPKDWLASVVAK